MPGLGYRTWVAGEKARSANIQSYLQDQTIMVFSTTTVRDASLTSPSEGMVAYISTDDKFMFYNGVAWVDFLYPGQYITTWTPVVFIGAAVEYTSVTVDYARWSRVGRRVHAFARITFDATPPAGTGNLNISLPVSRVSVTGLTTLPLNGSARILDSSAATNFFRTAATRSGAPTRVEFYSEAGAAVTQASPVPWAAADVLEFSVIYEAAA